MLMSKFPNDSNKSCARGLPQQNPLCILEYRKGNPYIVDPGLPGYKLMLVYPDIKSWAQLFIRKQLLSIHHPFENVVTNI